MVSSRRSVSGMLRPMNPCMTTWPAYVPTLEEAKPEASSASGEGQRGVAVQGEPEPGVDALQGVGPRDAGAEEQPGGDQQHGQVDQPGEAQRDERVDALVAQRPAALRPAPVAAADRVLVSAECR